MKILQLTNRVPWPSNDGETIATLALSKGFFLLGHRVTILAMNPREHYVDKDNIPEQLKTDIHFKLVDVNTEMTTIGVLQNLLFSHRPYPIERFVNEHYSRALIRLLDRKKFDVIQLEGITLCSYIPLIRRHSKALIVYRAHNIEYEIWHRAAKLKKGPVRLYYAIIAHRMKEMEIECLNQYDLLVSMTERDGNVLCQLGNRRPMHTSQTGIDLSSLIPTARELEYPSLFHIGGLDWAPTQEGLIWFVNSCWPAIHRNFPDLHFYIAGRYAPDWLIAVFKEKKIDFLGEVDDAYRFMNSKAIMVVPLLSGSGIRIKIIEGMALGKAIVSTSIGMEGIPAIDRENIMKANGKNEFVDCISELVNDRNLYTQICQNAVDFIRGRFDNTSMAIQLIDFYNHNLSIRDDNTN